MKQPLLEKIATVRRRVMILVWIRALCFFAVCLAVSILLAGAVDYLLRVEAVWLRFLYSFFVVAVLGWAGYRWMVPAFRYRPDEVRIAGRIETATGEAADHLATSVQIARERRLAGRPGTALETSLMEQVAERIQKVPVSKIVNFGSGVQPLILLVAVGLLCGGIALAWQGAVWQSLDRLGRPWAASARWPRQNRLVIESLPDHLARGSSLNLVVRDESGLLTAGVFAEMEEAGEVRRLELTAVSTAVATFTGRFENLSDDVRVRAWGGDDRTDWQRIPVVDVPKLVSLETRISPPAYADTAETTTAGPVECRTGSVIRVSGRTDATIRAADLVFRSGSRRQRFPLVVGQGSRSFYSSDREWLVATESGEYQIELENAAGIRSLDPPRWPLTVVADEPPTIETDLTDRHVGLKSRFAVRLDLRDELPLPLAQVTLHRNVANEETRLVSREVAIAGGVKISEFRRRFSAGIEFDLAALETLETGDRILITPQTVDRAGQSSGSPTVAVDVVAEAKLVEILQRQVARLNRLFGEMELQQSLVNQQFRARLEDRSEPPPAAERISQLRQGLLVQQRMISLFEQGDRSTLATNRQILRYGQRHRLEWTARANLQLLLEAQQTGMVPIVSGLKLQVERIGKQLDLAIPADNQLAGDLKELADLQDRFLAAIRSARRLLEISASFDELVRQARRLRDEQRQLVAGAADSRDATRQPDSLLVEQRRLRLNFERFFRQLQQAASVSADEEPLASRAGQAVRHVERADVLGTLMETEWLLAGGRRDAANGFQQTAAAAFQKIVEILNPGEAMDGSPASENQGLLQRVNDLVEMLEALDSRLQRPARDQTPLDESLRRELSERKAAIRGQLGNLKDEIDRGPFATLAALVGEAIQSISGSPNSVEPSAVARETKHIREAIGQLQRLAQALAGQSPETRSGASDLTEVLEGLQQLVGIQESINRWSQETVAGRQSDATGLDDVSDLQRRVANGFEVTRQGLARYPTAGILTASITSLLVECIAHMQNGRVDESLLRRQRRLLGQMQQLVEAIEIQLEATRQTTEVDTEAEGEQSDKVVSGISSFELTMLYVLQKNLHEQAETLLARTREAGAETAEIRQARLELATLQNQIARTLEELLKNRQDVVPELPDF